MGIYIKLQEKERIKMAIKGCARQMIVLNGIGGSIFEKAYFIVKPDAADASGIDMLREANRIVEENCFRREKKTTLRRWIWFAVGCIIGAAIVGGLWIIFGG